MRQLFFTTILILFIYETYVKLQPTANDAEQASAFVQHIKSIRANELDLNSRISI